MRIRSAYRRMGLLLACAGMSGVVFAAPKKPAASKPEPTPVATPAAAPAAAPSTAPAGADAISANLDTAKAQHEKDVAEARKILVTAIDTRMNAAADAGDLASVQQFQAAKTRAARDGTVADDMKDPAVLAAKRTMEDAMNAAHAKLASAYREAISSYTKARKFDDAVAIQTEFKKSGYEMFGPAPAANNTPAATGGPSAIGGVGKGGIGTGGPIGVVPPPGAGKPPAGIVGVDPFPPPNIVGDKLEVDLAGPVDETAIGGSGRYLCFLIKRVRQLAIFDVSQAKVVKYIPLPSNEIVFSANAKKLFIGVKDLKKIQRWDLAKGELELSVAAPEGGIVDIAAGASSGGPIIVIGEKRFWLFNPTTLAYQRFPSKNWGNDGAAWGPVHARISFDGTTAIAYGGGWAGVELSSLTGLKATVVQAGGYVHGEAYVAGNGGLVFQDEGGIIRSDLKSKVTGVEGKAFPAADPAFSLAIEKNGKKKTGTNLVVFSNADPKPLITIRDLKELGQESNLPPSDRVFLIPAARTLVTLAEGNAKVLLRKFDLAAELEKEGVDYLFVDSAPIIHTFPGARYNYKLSVKSKRGGVKFELQSGPKGMSLSKDGVLSWAVPFKAPADSVSVIVQISDASGQTAFHTFSVSIAENVVPKK